MFCRSLELEPVDEQSLCRIICFPNPDSRCCYERLEELRLLGIEAVYSYGGVVLEQGVRVVGKGHAAVVVLANHRDYGVVALKVRRRDSKRVSMEWEAKMLEKAAGTGCVPKLYSYSTNFLVREFVDGCTLEEILVSGKAEDVRRAVVSVIKAAFALDSVGVDVVEISRPLRQIVYLCCDPTKPFFIDLESAKTALNPLNVTKVVGFLISSAYTDNVVRGALNLGEESLEKLVALAKEYKSALDPVKKRATVENILRLLS